MPDIGDVYYLSNAIFFDFDGNPLVITGPPDHYFVVYDIVGEICFAKELTSNSTCWHELSAAYKPITAPPDFLVQKVITITYMRIFVFAGPRVLPFRLLRS